MKIVIEVQRLTNGYVRKGGKKNRKQQQNRMIEFAKFCGKIGANSLGEVGKNHVISYWKMNRDLENSTAYSHWLAIKKLFELAGKGEPPKSLENG